MFIPAGLTQDALGIGHWALGIGHWALGIGHWAWGTGKTLCLSPCPLTPNRVWLRQETR
ncbi:rRNA small subunit methyltransferase H [Nostoc sphaeroides CCNUC1]|uniref:rRNA small subunit methyltransferase H n=1 Tax=Nostoc sphaeroides CCNUC1 TaxID=2653204 RepID=A0A5P8W5Z7_9NOSO|nr:rRNA small subunit methyltransferase H [Nostoc sphaeroides CCNUC1]